MIGFPVSKKTLGRHVKSLLPSLSRFLVLYSLLSPSCKCSGAGCDGPTMAYYTFSLFSHGNFRHLCSVLRGGCPRHLKYQVSTFVLTFCQASPGSAPHPFSHPQAESRQVLATSKRLCEVWEIVYGQ